MLHRFKTMLSRVDFYRKTAEILKTRPMPIVDAPWRIVSIVSASYVQMYIIALKSFYRRMGAGKVTAIIDRKMPSAAISTLVHHFPGIEFAVIEDIQTGPCQRGGTWERLLYLIDRSQEDFAIQLDADTITIGDIPEVIDCATSNVAFLLSGSTGQYKGLRAIDEIRPMTAVVENARQAQSDYIGVVAERRFDEFEGHDRFNYVRGSSAFVGLARGGATRELVEHFHREGERMHKARWREWGTEQSASNFTVANTPAATVLPYPKYSNFDPDAIHPETSFLHFIGSRRYVGDVFADLSNKEIAKLK